jgi:hypothetical protein
MNMADESPWKKVREAACDFFHCADENLRVESENGGTVYADGGRDFSVVFSADHTDVECEVHYYHVSDECSALPLPPDDHYPAKM